MDLKYNLNRKCWVLAGGKDPEKENKTHAHMSKQCQAEGTAKNTMLKWIDGVNDNNIDSKNCGTQLRSMSV